ncbi:MAG TPA: hypothetical protein VFV17_00855, partial [Usitatibacteraceae bacterium]|nr:hypothetical protein [Usitatibacteraceae bacterium]
DYTDRVTQQRIPAVTTGQIYKGSIAFIILQLIMVAVVMMYPNLVLDQLDKAPTMDPSKIEIKTDDPVEPPKADDDPAKSLQPAPSTDEPKADAKPESKKEKETDPLKAALEANKQEDDDPAKALMDAVEKDRRKPKPAVQK